MEPELLKLFNEWYESGDLREWDGVIGRAMECMRVLGWEYRVKNRVPSYLEIKAVIADLAETVREFIKKGEKLPIVIRTAGFEMEFDGNELQLKFIAASAEIST